MPRITPNLSAALRQAQIESTMDRQCFVCATAIPKAQGSYHAGLHILTHQGSCFAAAEAEKRVFDRSPRGRWRPRGEVLRRLFVLRPVTTPES